VAYRVFGEIEGVKEGDLFDDRRVLSAAGVHRPTQAGISGSVADGADSIVLSGGYEDDEDMELSWSTPVTGDATPIRDSKQPTRPSRDRTPRSGETKCSGCQSELSVAIRWILHLLQNAVTVMTACTGWTSTGRNLDSGSASDASSTSPAVSESVELVTRTSLKSSLNPSTSGKPVTFTATVTANGAPPSGTVTFKNGAASIGTAALSGGVASLKTSSLPVGSLHITVVYGGSAYDKPSTSPELTKQVNP